MIPNEIYFKFNDDGSLRSYKQFIVNNSISLNHFFKKNIYTSIGFTKFNTKKYAPTGNNSLPNKFFSIQYSSFDFGIGTLFTKNKKNEINLTSSYIGKGQMEILSDRNGYLTYNIKVSHNF